MYTYYIYILTNKKKGILYSGFTNNIIRTVYEHRSGLLKGYTKKHSIKKLVYLEKFKDIEQAINWNDYIKEMGKEDKFSLIEQDNPEWKDFYYELGGNDKYEFYDEQIIKHRKGYAYR